MFSTINLFDEILDFLASSPSAEAIIAFRPSETLQNHVSALLEKNRHGQLSDEENQELNEFERMNHLMSMLKIRARKSRSSKSSAT